MTHTSKLAALCGAVGLALIAISGTAAADGYEVAAPAPPTRAASSLTPSTSASTSDYVFRGISQNDNDPTMQGGIDLGYGILYAGVWASGINFDAIVNDADLEVDWYGGIKPTWGPATFDFGVIYYSYPGATYTTIPPFGFDLNYVELKAGVSGTIHKDLARRRLSSTGRPTTSPRPAACGRSKATPAYTFHQVGVFTPVISGVVGYQTSSDDYYDSLERLQRVLVLQRRPRADRRKADVRLPLLGHRRLERRVRRIHLHQRLLRLALRLQRQGRSSLSYLSQLSRTVGAGQIARPRLFWASAASAY